MATIHHKIFIGAPIDRVYHALTTQEGLSGWWTPHTTAQPQVDSIARFGFNGGYVKEMRILKLDPLAAVHWVCLEGTEEWVGTTLSFELQQADQQTLVRQHPEMEDQAQQNNAQEGTVVFFHHNDWKAFTPMFAECNYTWAQFLKSLKRWCEEGVGTPWPHQHQ